MLRKILIGFAILVLLLVGAGAYLYHKIHPIFQEVEARQKMLQPRLVKGKGKFERRTYYAGESLGNISQIRVGWPADREGADIAVVGDQGVHFVDSTGQVKKRIRFSIEQHCPITVTRIDATGDYGYLTRDESWSVPATLFDKEGQVSWRSKDGPGVDDSVPGDVTGDGKLSVAIGFNGGGGIALLDGQGKELWKKEEGNVWHVEALDTNGDGRDEILHSNAKGQLLVRNGNGDIIARYLPNFYVDYFALTPWGGEARPSHVLARVSKSTEDCCKRELILLDANGKIVDELESPMGDLFTWLNATPVRFGEGVEYFAVLEATAGGSMLLLYGKDGQIAYQEILGEPCLGMVALPKRDGERLLVGCAAKVWEYSPVLARKTASTQTAVKDH